MRSTPLRPGRTSAAFSRTPLLLVGALALAGGACQSPPRRTPPPPPATMPTTIPAESAAILRQMLKGQTYGQIVFVYSDDPKLALIDDVEGGNFTAGDVVTVLDPRDGSIVNHGTIQTIGEDTKKPILRCNDAQAKRPPATGDYAIKR